MMLTLVPFLIALFGVAAADPRSDCIAKNHQGAEVIDQFCNRMKNMVIPSPYASNGVMSDDMHTWVKITGNCKPAQWVPQKYCYSQLYDMCSYGGAHGGNKKYFGKSGCQKWEIRYNKHPLVGSIGNGKRSAHDEGEELSKDSDEIQ